MRFDALEPALAALESRTGELAEATADTPAETKLRRYSPEEQIVARFELSGPERRLAKVHAGVDVHGDGATKAYTGRVRRRAIEPAQGEDAIEALRRALDNR